MMSLRKRLTLIRQSFKEKIKMKYAVKLFLIVALGCFILQARGQSKPNIIFVFLDDLGYGDLPLYGNAGVATPSIDKLAKEGMHFTQFYVNSPICSPSRVAVTTGQYPLRWNITSYLADSARNINRGMAHHLDPKAPSVARILQQDGYYTAHVGKWHLGGQRNVAGAPMITEFGFNTSFTSFEGLGERIGLIFETHEWNGSNRFPLSVQQEKLGHGEVNWVKRHDEPQIYVDRALEEIKKAQDKDQPFYVNLWTSAVHTPIEAPPALRGDGSIESQYTGLITNLDIQLGKLFDYIRNDRKLRENTVIILTSDNGPSRKIGSSGGLRGKKGDLYEGGIKEPLIVWAPGMMKANYKGKVNKNTILAGMDLPPSILSVAGVKKPDTVTFDGLNMKEVLMGRSDENRETPVMWVRPPERKGPEIKDLAIREGNWKLLVDINGNSPELYNIETNPGETINLAEENPELTAQLQKKVFEWFYNARSYAQEPEKPWQ
jgi:arylsulfatase A-like enzyme